MEFWSMVFCDYLKSRCNELRLKQTDIADRLDVKKQAVSKWFNGTSIPEIHRIPKLAEILQTDPFDLVAILWSVEPVPRKTVRKNVFLLETPFDILGLFAPGSIRQEAGKKVFRVVCTEDEMGSFLEKYARRYEIKVISPLSAKKAIIKNRFPGWDQYRKEELFDFFLTDILSDYDVHSNARAGEESDDKSAVRAVIVSKYKRILTFDKVRSVFAGGADVFDRAHRELCDNLVDAEAMIVRDPLFSDSAEYSVTNRYFNAQYVVNYLIYRSAEYGIFQIRDHYIIHPVILKSDLDGVTLDTYDDYLKVLERLRSEAEKLGYPDGFSYDNARLEKKKNVLCYDSDDAYFMYLEGLNEEELIKEFYLCVNLEKEIRKMTDTAVDQVEKFIDQNFQTLENFDKETFMRRDGKRIPDTFEGRINFSREAGGELFRKKLMELYGGYTKFRHRINSLYSYGTATEPDGVAVPGDIKAEIYKLHDSILGPSRGNDGSFYKFRTFVNDIGVHVCSMYYHMFNEVLDPTQTVTSETAKDMLIRYGKKEDISFPDTVIIFKKELIGSLNKIGVRNIHLRAGEEKR